jgi:branched-chain amino acid aminotransferase
MIENGVLYTSPLEDVLPGVTRGRIISLAKSLGIGFEEKKINFKEVDNLNAMFISGTSPKILPIAKVDNITLDVNNDIMQKLIKGFNEEIIIYINKFR